MLVLRCSSRKREIPLNIDISSPCSRREIRGIVITFFHFPRRTEREIGRMVIPPEALTSGKITTNFPFSSDFVIFQANCYTSSGIFQNVGRFRLTTPETSISVVFN
ncbi:MAG: hypothetical protein JW769_05290 [Parachlamydiales bacterium]|nr:hypothetical protein [Parachlamydiales bacterium]